MRVKVRNKHKIPWFKLIAITLGASAIGLAGVWHISNTLDNISPEELDQKIRETRASAAVVSDYIKNQDSHN